MEPIEEIMKSLLEELACISIVIPLIRIHINQDHNEDDHGMQSEMLWSIERQFANVEEEEVLAMTTIMDQCYKDNFFSSAADGLKTVPTGDDGGKTQTA